MNVELPGNPADPLLGIDPPNENTASMQKLVQECFITAPRTVA